MAITTTAEYKTYAGITDATNDTYIGTLVTTAQELAEDFIGYTLDGASRTETYDGGGSNVIVLNARPVVSITSVTPIDSSSVAGTAWASTDYKVDLNSGELRLTPENRGRFVRDDFGVVDPEPFGQFSVSPSFDDQFQSVRVVYLAGWGSSPYTAAPTRLKMALWRIIDAMFQSRAIATGTSDGELVDVQKVVESEMKPYARMYP